MKKILIRADDLGYSEGVNYGIAKSIKEGIIQSAGLMCNMPSALHGVELLKGTSVCLGQHTNICVGNPICDPTQIPSITNASGQFKSSREYRDAQHDLVVLDEVILEIEAQYERFVELTGEQPHYLEGHAIASDNFMRGLELVAKRHNLKYTGIPLQDDPIRVGNTDVYMRMDAMKSDYNPLITLKDMVLHAHKDACDVMVCHPGYLDDYILKNSSLTIPRTLEVEMAINPTLRSWLKEQNVVLMTYDDL